MDNKNKTVTINDYDRVIRASVAKTLKKYGFGWDRYEDWVQQMWMEVLEAGAKAKKPNNLPDLALVPTICRRRIGDWFKKAGYQNKRMPSTKLSLDDILDYVDPTTENSGINNFAQKGFRASIDQLWAVLDDKEKEYFKFWLEKVGIEDFGIHPPIPVYSGHGPRLDGYQEDYIAKRLGFPSGTAASFRTFKKNFRKKAAKYLGTLKN